MTQSLLLDRDGVINKLVGSDPDKVSPQSIDQFRYLPGSKRAIERSREAGISVYVFSNQPDVSKPWRKLNQDRLNEINQELRHIGVNKVFNCTHGPKLGNERRYKNDDGNIVTCNCRKPQSGLIKDCYNNTSMNPSETIVVGDNSVDIVAATRFEEEYDVKFESKVRLESKNLYGLLNTSLQVFAGE